MFKAARVDQGGYGISWNDDVQRALGPIEIHHRRYRRTEDKGKPLGTSDSLGEMAIIDTRPTICLPLPPCRLVPVDAKSG